MAEIRSGTLTWLHITDKKTGDILGESIDIRHVDEIQVLNFSIQVTGAIEGDKETDISTKDKWKPDFKHIEVTTVPGYGTSDLFLAASRGTQFDSITISCRKTGVFVDKAVKDAGRANGDYMQWRFYNCRITDWTYKNDLDVPSETINFFYESVEMIYLEQEVGGVLKYERTASWDRKKNNTREEPAQLPYKNLETGDE
jgi:type VI protein secretion system component Hcp